MTKKMKKYEAIIKLTKNQILKIINDEPFKVYHKYSCFAFKKNSIKIIFYV